MQTGKASCPDHRSRDQIDQQNLELNGCYLAMYVKCYQTGQMWSINPAFVDTPEIILTDLQIF
jgi:hypothetical protein